MDVSVLSKHRQRSLLSAVRTCVLGNGLLERTRSTSLALLGLTAAIGLAMVALALNQSWPLIAGAPIPGIGGGHQAVGDATVVATGGPASALPALFQPGDDVLGAAGSPGTPRRSEGKAPEVAGARAPGAAQPVVASPAPVSPVDASPPSNGVPDPAPVAQQPAPEPASTSPSTAEPVAVPVPVTDPSPSSPDPVPNTPESPAPPGAPGDSEGEEHGNDNHSGRGTGRGHGHSHPPGVGDSGANEPSKGIETPSAPSEDPSPEGNVPATSDAPESGPSRAPSWGHGGGHGYGHDRSHW